MALPTEGYGLYEEADPHVRGPNYYQPRLQAIAQAGFKLVMNYWLLQGHASEMVAYINYASSLGLKVIVALNDEAIWINNSIASRYTLMYADSGNQATDSGFTGYVISQVSGLVGTWGYYVGEEESDANHAALVTHANIIKAADSTHPRLYIDTVFATSTESIALNNSIFSDVSDVAGTDIYPIGRQVDDPNATATRAANIQAFCNAHSLQPAIVLQAMNWRWYQPTWTGASFPTQAQMQSQRDQALNNLSPRVILWYSFFDMMNRSDNPQGHWDDLNLAVFAPFLPSGYVAPVQYAPFSAHL